MSEWNFAEYPDNWKDLSAYMLKYAGYRCQRCGKKGNVAPHHKVPLSKGGKNHPSNLIVLCSKCHARHHPHLQRQQRNRKPTRPNYKRRRR